MQDKYYGLSVSIHRVDESYLLELSHVDPSSEAPYRDVFKGY